MTTDTIAEQLRNVSFIQVGARAHAWEPDIRLVDVIAVN
jgi:hypothetical protein